MPWTAPGTRVEPCCTRAAMRRRTTEDYLDPLACTPFPPVGRAENPQKSTLTQCAVAPATFSPQERLGLRNRLSHLPSRLTNAGKWWFEFRKWPSFAILLLVSHFDFTKLKPWCGVKSFPGLAANEASRRAFADGGGRAGCDKRRCARRLACWLPGD